MELKNCAECGRVFLHQSHDLCPACNEIETMDFKKVKEYLDNKRRSSADEVHDMTGVPLKRIIKFIREGRLTGMGAEVTLPCEGCGTPIFEGKFCSECKDRIIDNLTQGGKEKSLQEEYVPVEQDKPKQRTAGKMYTAERYSSFRKR